MLSRPTSRSENPNSIEMLSNFRTRLGENKARPIDETNQNSELKKKKKKSLTLLEHQHFQPKLRSSLDEPHAETSVRYDTAHKTRWKCF